MVNPPVMAVDDPRHGTNAGYMRHAETDKSYCDPCRAAHAEYHRNLWRRRYVLKVPSLYIDATGTKRRVQALQALGWRFQDIDEAAGVKSGWSRNSLIANRVNISQATGIKTAYEQLSMRLGPSSRVRTWARRKGWNPPLAWDDSTIDDPKGRPNRGTKSRRGYDEVDEATVLRALDHDFTLPTTRAEKEEITRRWLALGRSRGELERASGWNSVRYTDRQAGAA